MMPISYPSSRCVIYYAWFKRLLMTTSVCGAAWKKINSARAPSKFCASGINLKHILFHVAGMLTNFYMLCISKGHPLVNLIGYTDHIMFLTQICNFCHLLQSKNLFRKIKIFVYKKKKLLKSVIPSFKW